MGYLKWLFDYIKNEDLKKKTSRVETLLETIAM